MGYDANILIFKKKILENVKDKIQVDSFSDLYSCYLFTRLYDDEYDFPKDEKAKWVASPRRDLFNEFLEHKLNNGEARMIDEKTYGHFIKQIEDKLKSITLMDCVDDEYCDCLYNDSLINTYKGIKDNPVNFETEFVVFEHDW